MIISLIAGSLGYFSDYSSLQNCEYRIHVCYHRCVALSLYDFGYHCFKKTFLLMHEKHNIWVSLHSLTTYCGYHFAQNISGVEAKLWYLDFAAFKATYWLLLRWHSRWFKTFNWSRPNDILCGILENNYSSEMIFIIVFVHLAVICLMLYIKILLM